MIQFILDHIAILAALGVALVDFVWAIVPGLQSNGLLHAIYNFLVSKKAPPQA